MENIEIERLIKLQNLLKAKNYDELNWEIEQQLKDKRAEIRQTNREQHQEDYPEDARARTFDGGF